MKNKISDILKGKIVIMGVGNVLHGDDGFGSAFVKQIKESVDAVCIDAGNAPENYAGKIAKLKPDTILIVDAVHLNLNPGEYDILVKDDITESGFTTHSMSVNMFIEYLENETNADIYVLGIQPENTTFGSEMSEKVEKTLKDLSELVIGSIKR
jgi:hydrogenase 3 maturation protease